MSSEAVLHNCMPVAFLRSNQLNHPTVTRAHHNVATTIQHCKAFLNPRQTRCPLLLPCVFLCVAQERASKQLPGAGQHFSFGALKPWEDILAYLDEKKSERRAHVWRIKP